MKIQTNYHYYPLLYLHELPLRLQKRARRDFDWDENLSENACLFVYHGNVYHVEKFTWNSNRNPYQGQEIPELWSHYANDTFFSGVMFRLVKEDNTGHYLIQIATYYAGD